MKNEIAGLEDQISHLSEVIHASSYLPSELMQEQILYKISGLRYKLDQLQTLSFQDNQPTIRQLQEMMRRTRLLEMYVVV